MTAYNCTCALSGAMQSGLSSYTTQRSAGEQSEYFSHYLYEQAFRVSEFLLNTFSEICMSIDDTIHYHFADHLKTIELVHAVLVDPISEISQILAQSLANEGTLFWAGNGGSAADSQHLAAELVGRFSKKRKALRSIALNTDTSILTCVANDFSYDQIFSRQLEALARPGDVFIGVSTSGNSPNIIKAFEVANKMSVETVGLLGKDGGEAKSIVNVSLVVPSSSTARIQEAHILIGHILCDLIEKELSLD